jgi:hypothetical protein
MLSSKDFLLLHVSFELKQIFLLAPFIYVCRAVEDIRLILEGTVKSPDKPRNISSTADLVEQCAANKKLAKVSSE